MGSCPGDACARERSGAVRRAATLGAAARLGSAALLALAALGIGSAPVAGRTSARAIAAQAPQAGDWALININNISMWLRRDGSTSGNPYTDNSGLTFPRSAATAVYRDGLVWGGKVLDGDPAVLRVGGSTYAQGCVPGRILAKGVAADPGDPRVRIYRVRRDYQTADLRLEAAEYLDQGLSEVTAAQVEALRDQYARDWRDWPAEWGAPYDDRDGDGRYDPGVDEPGVANADQVAWYAINDLDEGAALGLYGSRPIGLEVQVTLWAYARTDALGDVVFKRYAVTYKGAASTPAGAVIDSMYLAQWSDPDLGDYGDDFVGCVPSLDLGYVYNSRSRDSHYRAFGLAPPAVGYCFLNRPLTSFVGFAAGSSVADPELGSYVGTQQWISLLRGYQPQPDVANPVPYTNPLTGQPTPFTLDGTPTVADYAIPMAPQGNALDVCGDDAACREGLAPRLEVAAPGQTTGQDYTLVCQQSGDEPVWKILRGSVLLRQDLPIDQDIELAEDGIRVAIPVSAGMREWSIPSGQRWWTWVGGEWGAEGFEGAITGDPRHQWFVESTVTPSQTRAVELRFSSVVTEEGEGQYRPLDLGSPNVSYAYRYLRRPADPAPAPGDLTSTTTPYDWGPYIVNRSGTYAFQDRSPICLSAWDVTSSPPRRLEVGFLENNAPGGLVNGAYGPAFYERVDNIAASGPREWLFVFDRDYTGDPGAGDAGLRGDIAVDAMPIMWIVFAARRAIDRFPQDGDSFLMVPWPPQVYAPGDTFTGRVPRTVPPVGWIDGTELPAGDRRVVLSTGPFSMSLGETQELVIAVVGGLGQDNLESLNRLKANIPLVKGFYGNPLTAVLDEGGAVLPPGVVLEQNYPNPFNSATVIRFSLPARDEVELVVRNLAGQRAATLVRGEREAGRHAVTWDSRDDGGRDLASGVYLCQLRVGPRLETRKLLLLR